MLYVSFHNRPKYVIKGRGGEGGMFLVCFVQVAPCLLVTKERSWAVKVQDIYIFVFVITNGAPSVYLISRSDFGDYELADLVLQNFLKKFPDAHFGGANNRFSHCFAIDHTGSDVSQPFHNQQLNPAIIIIKLK